MRMTGMRRPLLILAVMASFWSQAESQSTGIEAGKIGLTKADLHGVVIEATALHQQVIQRDGKEYPNRQRNDLKITVTGDRIEGWNLATGTNQYGVFKGKQLPISSTLQRPGTSHNVGGGNRLWIFQNGTLIHFYVYKGGGALRREISFSRTSSGLACTFRESFARENGAGPITWSSSVDGARTSLLMSKQVSASCRVTRKQP